MKHIKKLLFLFVLTCIFSGAVNFNNISTIKAAVSRTPKLNVRVLNITKNSAYKLRVYNTLDNYTVSFEADDTSLISISKAKGNSCRIKPKASGSTIIYAYVYDSEDELVSTLSCKVIVSPSAASVKFNRKKYTLTEGMSKRIKAIIKPNISNEMPLYSSDNTAIATVSSNGTVTALSAGQVIIHATISNGRTSSYMLTVTKSGSNKSSLSQSNQNQAPQPSSAPDATDSAKTHDNTQQADTAKSKKDFSHYNYEPLSTPVGTCDE